MIYIRLYYINIPLSLTCALLLLWCFRGILLLLQLTFHLSPLISDTSQLPDFNLSKGCFQDDRPKQPLLGGCFFNLNLYQHTPKCVNLDNQIFKYDTIFDFGVKIDIFEFSYFFVNFLCNAYLKNGIFKICFRQSAKSKMTAWHVR